ncbi:MAG: hypothetical protein KJ600_02930 [Nanoarchaeota archaeon]|nr:hypothetical protein [Nanoarchaeota archaeon]MBU1103483.1 hypothetical protein [Nanoarchaeota archaeon]
MEFDELKDEYVKFVEKYNLPSFQELDEDFEVGKIDRESDTLLRAIRKVMMEKIVNSLGFMEMLLNPMNAPRMYLSYIRAMGDGDKKIINKIYVEFSELSVLSLEREIDYDEKAEAELIKKVFEVWGELKPDFRKMFANMKKPNNDLAKKERSYFG